MTKQARPLIAGNWKMNGTLATGRAWCRVAAEGAVRFAGIDLLVCPPAVLIPLFVSELSGSTVAVGAQDCHAAAGGAHTGDIAAPMLADAGCTHVILGHSERRTDHGESNATVRAKAAAALTAGLVPIICVGETLSERKSGAAVQVVTTQLEQSVPDEAGSRMVIAYEPVWAIGSGLTPSVAEIADMHGAINRFFASVVGGAPRILYGGSMKPTNAREILEIAHVDGGLIGGASLNAGDFLAIAEAATAHG